MSTEEESSKCAGLGKCAMRKLKSLEDKDEDTQNVKLTANILRFLLAIMHHAISTNDEDTSTDFMQEVSCDICTTELHFNEFYCVGVFLVK